jgi:hypothetical protein
MIRHASRSSYSDANSIGNLAHRPLLETDMRAPSQADQAIDLAFVQIVHLALAIESDRARIEEWYQSEQIRELGGFTACELVLQDSADLVIGFLRSIRRGDRD